MLVITLIEIFYMFKRVIKLSIPLAIIIVAVLLAMALVGSRPELTTSADTTPLPRVNTLEVKLSNVPVSIIAHGNVSARHELDLASEVTGRVIWVAPEFEPGELVAAGKVLLRVDPVSYRLALAEAKAGLSRADTALADAKALKRKASVVEGKLNIEAAQERIIKAEQDLAYTEIRAPFNAVIDKQMVEPGQFINIGQTVARLLSTDTAQVSLPLAAAESGFLDTSAGTGVKLSAQMGADQLHWPATIVRVESRVDLETRVVPVVVEVARPYDVNVHPHRLPLGLFVEARLPGKPIAAAVRVPSSALQSDDSVFVLDNNTLRRRQVTIAYRGGDSVVISAGLKNGDRVVTSRLEVMFEGMKVEPADA
jgi:RND family efflux transporter MFP subunit